MLKNPIIYIFFGICFLQLNACKEEEKPSAVKQVQISFKKEGTLQIHKAETDYLLADMDIEIAEDDYATQTGLMYRDGMKNNQGMLFIFPDEDVRSFYMKNTKFPLDIIYIAEDKTIVSIQKEAQPLNETSLPSREPAKYVLEVNAGLSDEWGLSTGDLMGFERD